MTHRFHSVPAAVLILGGTLKLFAPDQAAGVLQQVFVVQFTSARMLVETAGLVELLSGLLVVFYPWSRIATWSALILLSGIVAWAIYLDKSALLGECGCFGSLPLPGGATGHFVLLGVSLFCLVASPQRSIGRKA